ncbi:muscle M-line assembly protein unc-89, partial [Biomphalaria glabrata]
QSKNKRQTVEVNKQKLRKKEKEQPETAPELVVKPRRQFTDEGAEAKFKCSFDGPDSSKLFWSKDGTVLSADHHYKIYESDGFHYLEVVQVVADDTGVYTVTVINSAGSDQASAELEVFVKPKLLSKSGPEWDQPLTDSTVHLGDVGVTFTCIAKDLTKPTVKWFHNDKEIVSGFHIKLTHEGQRTSLTFKDIRAADAGHLKCIMSGANGQLETSCLVSVSSDPEEDMEPPVFLRELQDQEVQEGDRMELQVEVKEVEHPEAPDFLTHTITRNACEGQSVTFKCQVKGHPLPSVVWEKNGVPLSSNQKYKMTQIKDQHTLTINYVDQSDEGDYICHLHNMVGEASAVCVLKVKSENAQNSTAETLKARLSRLTEIHSKLEASHTAHPSTSVLSFSAVSNEGDGLKENSSTNRSSTYHHSPVPTKTVHTSNSPQSNQTVKAKLLTEVPSLYSNISKMPDSKFKENSLSRVNQETQRKVDNPTDFRSVLHKSNNTDKTKSSFPADLKRSEVIDFRNVLKNKVNSPRAEMSGLNDENSELLEVTLKTSDSRFSNSSEVESGFMNDLETEDRNLYNTLPGLSRKSQWKYSEDQDVQDAGYRGFVDSLLDSSPELYSDTYSRNSNLVSNKEYSSDSDIHLETPHLKKMTALYEEADKVQGDISQLCNLPSELKTEATTNAVDQYTAIPVQFIEPIHDKSSTRTAERSFEVTMSRPINFVQSSTSVQFNFELQSELEQPEPEETNKVVSYIQFTPKSTSKSLSSLNLSPHHLSENKELLPKGSAEIIHDDDDVFAENFSMTTSGLTVAEVEASQEHDAKWEDDNSNSVVLRNKKASKNSAQVRFARTSEDLTNYTNEEKSPRVSSGFKTSSKSTSSYEPQEKPEFQCVQLRPAVTKHVQSTDLRSSKNLSKSTESLFKVKLKPVAPKTDSSSWKKSQTASNLLSAKSKSKSNVDLVDRGLYQRPFRDKKTSPSRMEEIPTSSYRVSKSIMGDTRSSQPKESFATKRSSKLYDAEKQSLESRGKKFAHIRYVSQDLSVQKELKKDTTVTKEPSIQAKVAEKKMLGEIGKSLSNSNILNGVEPIDTPQTYSQRHESKRHSIQTESSPLVSHSETKLNQASLKDSRSLSKSIGNLDTSTSSKVSSKRELFENLEQTSKPNWQKIQNSGGDRAKKISVAKVSTRKESAHVNTKPEWIKNATHKNIDEKIKALKKEKEKIKKEKEKMDHSIVPSWVKTNSVKESELNEKFRDVIKPEKQFGVTSISETPSPQSKVKTGPPVAPKPAKVIVDPAKEELKEDISDTKINQIVARETRKPQIQNESQIFKDTGLAKADTLEKDFRFKEGNSLESLNSINTHTSTIFASESSGISLNYPEALRSSTEDLDSVISVSSSSSDVSLATGYPTHAHDDSIHYLALGDKAEVQDASRKDKIRELKDKQQIHLTDVIETRPSTFTKEESKEENVEQTSTLPKDKRPETRLGSTSSQDSGLILDLSNPALNPSDLILVDVVTDGFPDKTATSTWLGHTHEDEMSPALILKERRERRAANNNKDFVIKNVGQGQTQNKNLNGKQSEETEQLESPQAYDRLKEFRSKFRDSKHWERVDIASTDTSRESTQIDTFRESAHASESFVGKEERRVQSRLKDKLKDLHSDYTSAKTLPENSKSILINRDSVIIHTADLESSPLGDIDQEVTSNNVSKSWLVEDITKERASDGVTKLEGSRKKISSPVNDVADKVWKPKVKGEPSLVAVGNDKPLDFIPQSDLDPKHLASFKAEGNVKSLGDLKSSNNKVNSKGAANSSASGKDPAEVEVLASSSMTPSMGHHPSEVQTSISNVEHQSCPPSFPSLLRDILVKYGCRTTLQCSVLGNPTPDIKWLHNLTPIEPSKKIEILYSNGVAKLIIFETFNEDVGDYTCWAKNPFGSLSAHCRLELEVSNREESRSFEGPVSREPRILSLTPKTVSLLKGSKLTLTSTFDGEPIPEVKWILNEEVLASDGRVEITTDSTSSVLTIQSVSQSDAGNMFVCISSSIGTDQSVTNINIEDVPGPPQGKPQVYEINKHSASLSWSPPSYLGGCPLTHYTIEAKMRQQTTWDVVVPQCQELNYHIQDLKPCSTYQFRVRASNKHGLGAPSEPSDRTITSEPFSSISDDDSEGYPEVFTPTIEYRRTDDLPFEPRVVTLNRQDKFQDLYELENEVGKGKFGVVYKCKQKKDGKTFAAKILKSREKNMILHEIEIMNCLRHPKLLLLWDAYEEFRRIILVMEYVGAGELFERVIGDDFVLTERDCVHFLRQICEGVNYMHSLNILHLDLKPENILCVAENSNRIKIIDFGLARRYNPNETVKVMFGTPEFIAPEVINYDAISYHTDMWSIGVICYVLLSGLSPFLGDDENETLVNVTSGEFDFDDEAFEQISDEAKDFINKLLLKEKESRMLTSDCLAHTWLSQDEVDGVRYKRLNTERLKKFMVRRKWLKTGKAVLAVGRLIKSTSLNNLFRSSSNDSLLSASTITPVTSSTNSVDDEIACADEAELTSEIQVQTEATIADIQIQDDVRAEKIEANIEKNVSVPLTDLNENHLRGHNQEQTFNNSNSSELNRTHPSDPLLQFLKDLPKQPKTNLIENRLRETGIPASGSEGNTSSEPNFTKTMKRSKTFVGDVARFDVTVSANPEPVVTWFFDNEELHPDDRHIISMDKISGSHWLIIRGIQEDDEGDYSCKAVNSLGEVTCSAELSVLSF